jgi:hypothetical protein
VHGSNPEAKVLQEVDVPTEPQRGVGAVDPGSPSGASSTTTVAQRLAEESATADTIYGVIVSSAVMASAHGQSVTRLAVATLSTLIIYWTAERYAHLMARRITDPAALTWRALVRELGHGWELVTASFMPLGVLLASRVLGASVSGAVLAGLLCATALLSAAGWQVGREADLAPASRLVSAVFGGAVGVAMILLKTLLH